MASLAERISRLKQGTLEVATTYQASIGKKRSREVTLHHPEQDAGVHIRDDGAVEIFAGAARIILNQDGTIYSTGSMIITEGEEVHTLSGAQNTTINGAKLNPEVYTPRMSELFGATDYPKLPVPDPKYWNIPLVVGAPAGAEQQNLMMSDYWKSMNLFGEGSNDKLRSKLEDLINGN
jgi:hypothetical protein